MRRRALMSFDINLIRGGFIVAILVASCYLQQPAPGSVILSGFCGLLIAVTIIFFETRIRRASIKTLIGGAFGSVLGIVGASLIGFLISVQADIPPAIKSYLTLVLIMFMGYVGLIVGAVKGDYLDFSLLGGLLHAEKGSTKTQHLILDTSVIIDGRVADVAETGFLGGQLVIPQFMLRELQQVADSADSAKRNRGRRGLDILQRIQKNSNLDVQVSDIDFPDIREVDHKLIELAKQLNGKIVTNDFNLNKVAQLRGVAVLNINELANALKPVVLPGETMKVFVLKEGKEYNQGVAYLDDGTMVVIDHARRFIGKNIEISVTSVLQTTAGKMIFGKYTDEGKSFSPEGKSFSPEGKSFSPESRNSGSEGGRAPFNEGGRQFNEHRNQDSRYEPRPPYTGEHRNQDSRYESRPPYTGEHRNSYAGEGRNFNNENRNGNGLENRAVLPESRPVVPEAPVLTPEPKNPEAIPVVLPLNQSN